MNKIAKGIGNEPINLNEFRLFIQENHDHFIRHDPSIRAFIYRIIRRLIRTDKECSIIIEFDLHLMVLVDFEKANDGNFHRTEAFKLIKNFAEVSAFNFPIEFASSLVAIAGSESDPFRQFSLEALVNLAATNYSIILKVNGFKVMLDAVLDPAMSEISECIILVILYLLDDPRSRAIVQHYVDLKSILAPFTDLDTSNERSTQEKRKCAKRAIKIILRSWTGIIILTSDPSCLSSFVNLLEKKGVSKSVQEDIIDTIAEIFEPLVNRVTPSLGSKNIEKRRFYSGGFADVNNQGKNGSKSSPPKRPSFNSMVQTAKNVVAPTNRMNRAASDGLIFFFSV